MIAFTPEELAELAEFDREVDRDRDYGRGLGPSASEFLEKPAVRRPGQERYLPDPATRRRVFTSDETRRAEELHGLGWGVRVIAAALHARESRVRELLRDLDYRPVSREAAGRKGGASTAERRASHWADVPDISRRSREYLLWLLEHEENSSKNRRL